MYAGDKYNEQEVCQQIVERLTIYLEQRMNEMKPSFVRLGLAISLTSLSVVLLNPSCSFGDADCQEM